MKKLILVALALSIMGCTDPEGAVRALNVCGMHNVTLTGWTFSGCGKLAWNHTGFIAVTFDGTAVEGTVCTGYFTDTTVMYRGQ